MTRVACVQLASGPNVSANLMEVERQIAMAVQQGAGLVVLPENFAIMGKTEAAKLEVREQPGAGPIQEFLAQQADRHGIWLVGGTVPLVASDPGKVRAACLLFNDRGEQVARYDKIHLFDVELEQNSERYTESETIEPGSDTVVADTPFGRLGLAVCYDLRFPELFRSMLDEGMELVALPSAFTAVTGSAHWELLVRARAVENLCYVIAAAQGGYHVNGRSTYGHSMIVDPWGGVLGQLATGTAVVTAELDRDRLERIRRTFPAIQHRSLTCRV